MAIGFVSDPAKNILYLHPLPTPQKNRTPRTNGTVFISFTTAPARKRCSRKRFAIPRQEKFPSKISPITIAGIPAQKVEHKDGETDIGSRAEIRHPLPEKFPSSSRFSRGFSSGAPSQASLISPGQAAELEKIVARTRPGAPPMSLGGVSRVQVKRTPSSVNGGISSFSSYFGRG